MQCTPFRPFILCGEILTQLRDCGGGRAPSKLTFISQRSESLPPSQYDRSTDRSRSCFALSARRATSRRGWLGMSATTADGTAHQFSRLRDTRLSRRSLGKLKIARGIGRARTYHRRRLAHSNPGSSQHRYTGLLNPLRPSRLALVHPSELFPRNESFRLLSGITRKAGCLTSCLHHTH